eukprot:scaffold3823_cov60-Phaeocystis_antarctica.AAC.3
MDRTAQCEVWQCGPRNTCRVKEEAHACPARLPHRLRRHSRRSLLVRVEKLLGDFERAELIVPSEYCVVLHRGRRGPMSGAVLCLRWKEIH